jgi:mRNA interferase MazF
MPAGTDASAPDVGDVLWIDFGPPIGREQAGRRPALVLTSRAYNERSSVLIVCPITRRNREWPTLVPLPPVGALSGFIIVDQIKVIDPAVRAFRSAGRISADTLAEVRAKLSALLGIATGL